MIPEGDLREEDLFLGGALLLLLLQPHAWMHRRVEHVSFIDERSLIRHVSVDLTLPSEAIYGSVLEGMPFMPLAFLDKEVLVGFDVRDETGGSIPVLTKEQNGRVAWSVLLRAAGVTLESAGVGEVDGGLRAELYQIANEAPEVAVDFIELIERRAAEGDQVDRALT